MTTLTRQHVIEQLQTLRQGHVNSAAASGWAFDQFYAEELGEIEFEPGYRRAIHAVLDELMFADQPGFHLAAADVDRLIQHLEQAERIDQESEEDEDNDEDEIDQAIEQG